MPRLTSSCPRSAAATYDNDGNGYIDEDHGHGTFVASLVKRMAPGADVVLAGVTGDVLPSGRWTPMMFSDADLIDTLDDAFGLAPLGRTTRRTFDVVNLSLGGAGCDGVAARLALGRFMRDLAVAARGEGRLRRTWRQPATTAATSGTSPLRSATRTSWRRRLRRSTAQSELAPVTPFDSSTPTSSKG